MSRVVFVGNIPFEMSEEQMIDIFKEVGPVISFKLMFDRETGKPRGFGFCEYADVETANSAIRNLNGFDIGGRNLKVGYADHEMPGSKPNQVPNLTRPSISQIQAPMGFPPSTIPTQHLPFPPPPPPHLMMRPAIFSPNGQNVFPSHPNHPLQMMAVAPTSSSASMTAASQLQHIKPPPAPISVLPPSVEAVNGILSSMSNAQLVELIVQLKNMTATSPDQARIFLSANPALSYALLQALLATNLVDPGTAQQLLASIPSQTAETNISSSSHSITHQVKGSEEKSEPASANVQNTPSSMPHLLDKERQQALIAQILSMTPEQIDLLLPEQRDQILMIRAQLQHQQQFR